MANSWLFGCLIVLLLSLIYIKYIRLTKTSYKLRGTFGKQSINIRDHAEYKWDAIVIQIKLYDYYLLMNNSKRSIELWST